MKLKQRVGNLDHGIVERQEGGKFKLDFRPWHGGRQGGNLNKELEFRSGIVEGKGELKSSILDHAIVEGKSGTIK